MIYTSYFANWRKCGDARKVGIAVGSPIPDVERRLFPRRESVLLLKSGSISKLDFCKEYMAQLGKLDPGEIYRDLDGTVLLCFEGKDEFCHRHLVAEWLRRNGYDVREL